MSTLKTSISVLAVVAGLTIGFAPQTRFAQSAGAATAGQAIKENVEKRDEQLAKLDKEREDRQRNLAKSLVKPETTSSTTGGTSGFTNPPPEQKPEGPGLAERCWNGICSVVKFLVAPGAVVAEHVINAMNEPEDEAKAQKEHNEAVHKAVEEKNKAEADQKKLEQPKTAVSPKSTELKIVDLKNVETKNNRSDDILTHKSATKLVSFEAAKARTLTVPRVTVTTVSHIEVSRPTVNVPRPTINIPQPTIRIPTIAHR
jgi:hypothetical protein